ncbi:MAG: hypothetical protein ABGW81_09625 [Paracoccaceae bacterium]
MADAGKLAVGGWILVNSERRMIVSLSGSSVIVNETLTIVPIGGDALAVDAFGNISGWIQAVKAKDVAQIFVVGPDYLNFNTSGDTVNTEQTPRASVRSLQRASAMAEGVEYVDTYAHMRDLILASHIAQGD